MSSRPLESLLLALFLLGLPGSAAAQAAPVKTAPTAPLRKTPPTPTQAPPTPAKARAGELGIPFGGQSGPLGAITDVLGVEVGHATVLSGQGRLVVGRGPVRTGVTVVWPRGKAETAPVFAATHVLNGNGEMTGTHWVNESGLLYGPTLLTTTTSVGTVRDAMIAWAVKRERSFELSLPVVAETYDGLLNDIDGFHVRQEHVFKALDGASRGPVAEGSVGGGTGMLCHGFKGGIGTASRKLPEAQGGYTIGVLVQCNYGKRRHFTVAGVPVGEEITDLQACTTGDRPPSNALITNMPACTKQGASLPSFPEGMGSIIVVVATDAPLLPHQLERMARRVPLGIGKMGGLGEDGSGDLFLAFSTQPTLPATPGPVATVSTLDNERMNPLFEATVQATQEAILNAMLAADMMTGADGIRIFALPHDRLMEAMRKYGRK
ncbi:P1 family peptidase [Hyalangium sp.]|uniref:DmpA family aminopeptidase n=1 Tax=Hyalangium sp. TaxID=2028555 RepID=UPI002D255BEA|nr:P1 family peptidase [Hyalangium sp.]HYI03027.1 P1 family peptidase [Hyalangium sp.]